MVVGGALLPEVLHTLRHILCPEVWIGLTLTAYTVGSREIEVVNINLVSKVRLLAIFYVVNLALFQGKANGHLLVEMDNDLAGCDGMFSFCISHLLRPPPHSISLSGHGLPG